jgi:hypothetical protein
MKKGSIIKQCSILFVRIFVTKTKNLNIFFSFILQLLIKVGFRFIFVKEEATNLHVLYIENQSLKFIAFSLGNTKYNWYFVA